MHTQIDGNNSVQRYLNKQADLDKILRIKQMVTIPIHQSRLYEIGDTLIEHVVSKHSIPEYMIMDQYSASMSTLISYLFKKLGIKIKMADPYNPSNFAGRTWN